MTTVKHYRNYKVTQYKKGFSVDFCDQPYAYYDDLDSAVKRFEEDSANWYSFIQ